MGGQRDWSASPITHLERRKQLRQETTLAERKLWSALRNDQLGIKFRRQHPVGPFIADFYSREAHLVIEVDGADHFESGQAQYDIERNAYMRRLAIFGSALRPDFRPGSDIDVLVEFEQGHIPGLFGIARMERELSALLGGRKVDLRTPEDMSRYFRQRVIEEAQVQYVQG